MNHLIWGRKLPDYQDDARGSATHHEGPTRLSPKFTFLSPAGLSWSLWIRKRNLLSSWSRQGTNMVTVTISGPRQAWQPTFYTEDWCFFGWHTKLVIDLEGCACHVPDSHALSHPSSAHLSSLPRPCQDVPSWFTFSHKCGVICAFEAIDISPGNLDSSLCFFQPSVSHDVLCI